jgi:hypothetical protein
MIAEASTSTQPKWEDRAAKSAEFFAATRNLAGNRGRPDKFCQEIRDSEHGFGR